MQFRMLYKSPAGKVLITVEDDAIISLSFSESDKVMESPSHPALQQCSHWLDRYFAGENPVPTEIPVRLTGTPFQAKVWHILSGIPYGQSVTYGDIAKQIAPNMSAQAVGRAVGSNPVPIIIPCHRVLGIDAKLTGYAYGLHRKQILLDLEKIQYRK